MPDTWIWIEHPDVKGPPVKVPQDSFDKLYKRKGWTKADKPVKFVVGIDPAAPTKTPPRFPVEKFDEGKPRKYKTRKPPAKKATVAKK